MIHGPDPMPTETAFTYEWADTHTTSPTPFLLLDQHILKHPIPEVDPVIRENEHRLQKVLCISNNTTKDYNLEISVHKSKVMASERIYPIRSEKSINQYNN
jgi:hypothetical protein